MKSKPNPLLAADELPSLAPTFVLDVRGRTAYDEGHWPGSGHLDIKSWELLARTAEGALERVEVWEAQIGALGIDGCVPVIVYDDGRMTEAARAWFILQWHGVDARVLDGGWPALKRLPHWIADQMPNVPEPVPYRRLSSHVPGVGMITRHELVQRLGHDLQVLDARTHGEHLGDDLRANPRGGHLPQAKWLAHAELLNPDGTLKTESELKARMAQAGITEGTPIATHCDAGGRAALAALAAVVAGHRDVHSYYLSFSDWAADDACPVVKP